VGNGGRRFAMVERMSDNYVDPSGNTEAFRAFTQEAPEPAAPARSRVIIATVLGAVALLAVVPLILWLVS
jgi:hypothetical protein